MKLFFFITALIVLNPLVIFSQDKAKLHFYKLIDDSFSKTKIALKD